MNLPVFSPSFCRKCKVLAVACTLCFCVGCSSGDGNVEDSSSPAVVGQEVTPPAPGESPAASESTGSESTESATATDDTTVSEDSTTEGGSADATAAQKPEPKRNAPKKVGQVRDPFANLTLGTAPTVKKVSRTKNASSRAALSSGKATAARSRSAKGKEIAEQPVPTGPGKPAVKVTGIMESESGRTSAIIQTESGSKAIYVGDILGGYKFVGVTVVYPKKSDKKAETKGQKNVVFVYKDKFKYLVPIEAEVFSSTGAAKASAKK